MAEEQAISSTMQENRVFPPPAEFSAKAWIKSRAEYERLYRESIDRPDEFWGKQAEALKWFKRWDRVLEWDCPHAKWFVGGKINVSYNCLDAQIEKGRGDKTAILWEGEPLITGAYEDRSIEFSPVKKGEANGAGHQVRRIPDRQLKD